MDEVTVEEQEFTQLARIERQLADVRQFHDSLIKFALRTIAFYLFLSLPWGALLRSIMEDS